MELFERIIALLDGNKIEYKLLKHEPVYTSEQAAAARTDVSLHQGAKAMVVKYQRLNIKDQKEFIMCVLPGDKRIDFKKIRKVLNIADATLASPEEVERVIGVKVGAVSPFGNLSGLKVLLDESICDNEEIVFNAGDHSKSVKMKLSDYLCVVNPERLYFSK